MIRSLPGTATWVIGATMFLNVLTLALIQPIFCKLILPEAGSIFGGMHSFIASFGLSTVLGFLTAWGSSWAPHAKQVKFVGTSWIVTAVLLGAATLPFGTFEDQPAPQQLESGFSVGLSLSACCAAIWFFATLQFLVPWWVASRSQSGLPSPYFFFAFWPLGSLFGIVDYHFVTEPLFTLGTRLLWVKVFFLGLGAMAFCSAFLLKRIDLQYPIREVTSNGISRPTWLRYCHWVGLAAFASALVLGVATYVSIEIAAIPLFWMLPLVLYETSLVVAFVRVNPAPVAVLSWFVQTLACLVWAGPVIYLVQGMPEWTPSGVFDTFIFCLFLESFIVLVLIPHRWTLPVQVGIVGLALICFGLQLGKFPMPELPVWSQVWLWLAACAVTWWGCHGELVQTRPDDQYLFRFVACIFLGVTLGILFMQTIVPALWDYPIEFHLVLGLAALMRLGTIVKRWPLGGRVKKVFGF